MEASQRPLELILARNLITSLSTPAFLLDDLARLVFYNEAAGALLGASFEESGRMDQAEWTSTFGPFDEADTPIPLDELETTKAVNEGRPIHARFYIHTHHGRQEIEASAFPIVASEAGASGAMIMFWPLGPNGSGQ
jgi:PAS domain-containing protein